MTFVLRGCCIHTHIQMQNLIFSAVSFPCKLYLEKYCLASKKNIKVIPFFYNKKVPSYDALSFIKFHCLRALKTEGARLVLETTN